MIHSPNKHTSVKRLKQIKKDNCIAESGKEFSEFEVDHMIVAKETAQAEQFVDDMHKVELQEAAAIMDRMAKAQAKVQKLQAQKATLREKKIYFSRLKLRDSVKQDQKLAFILKKELFGDQEFAQPSKFSQRFENKFISRALSAIGA